MKRRPTNLADYKQPLPHAIVDCLKDRPHPREGDNLGLWLDKYLPLAPDSFELKAEARTDILSRFFCARKLGRPIAWRSRSASEVVARQAQSCEAMFGKEGTYYLRLPMRVEGRLLIDYARLSTIESSLSFHATLGVPRIPGSALKGLLRATMRSEGDPELDELLGSPDLERDNDKTHKRGRLVLFDAFPDGSFELDLDVLTPHFGDYYGDTTGKTPPADWLAPVPTTFLTVVHTTFVLFAGVLPPPQRKSESETENPPTPAKDLLIKVKERLTAGLWEEGIGAKRAAGYGRLRPEKQP